jgi:eukaryotic-like serine/threonine-protein kinase
VSARKDVDRPAVTNYQFGAYEVDAASGELFKDGRRVRLQDQPFRLLVVLLENAGQVITREEIQRRIWPEAFVDFDGSLRVAVRKLREALGDDAERPVYVETIPKRGYRFLVPVNPVGTPGSPTIAFDTAPARKWSWSIAAAVAIVMIVTAGAVWLSLRRHKPVLSDKDTVVLADFANTTGDPVFDATLRQGLVTQLEQSPFLSLVSEERIQQVLRMMAQAPDTRLTPQVARAICERTGSAAVLDGSIARLGSEYVLGLRATSCRTGETLDAEQAQAARKEDVLNALDRIAGRFRSRLGESLATVKKYDTPLADATTPSLEALRAYSAGLRAQYAFGSAAAIPLFKQATEIDPNFALAHAWLGRTYGDVGEFEASAQSTTKAYELRDRVSQPEKFFIAASYDLQVSGNLEKAQQTCRAWTEAYPRAIIPHAFQAGIIDPVMGRFEHAVDEARITIRGDPDFWVGYLLVTYAYQYLNRPADAERMLDRAMQRKLEAPEFLVQRYDLAFVRNDQAAMDRAVSLAHGDAEAESWLDGHQAFVHAYSGQMRKAAAATQRAVAIAQQAGERERAAQFKAAEGVWNGFFGNAAEARRAASEALELSKARDIEFGAAVAFALASDSARAQALANDLEKRLPADTGVRFNYLPAIRALVALNDGKPAKAIELLQSAAPYELGATRSNIHAGFGALYPVYARGLAYLATRQGAAAATEFQKILDRRGVVVSDPVGALARYQLGRAYSMAGDTRKAQLAYEDVLALWKNADPDIAIVKQAKTEYAALR